MTIRNVVMPPTKFDLLLSLRPEIAKNEASFLGSFCKEASVFEHVRVIAESVLKRTLRVRRQGCGAVPAGGARGEFRGFIPIS